MRAIFISYRRDDAEGEAGRLFDDLVSEFGQDSVFMDVSTIEVGKDFRKVIDESIATCGVLLAIMGPNWVEAKNEAGERRLDDPADFVRLETASALKRDIPVIPVLVRSAKIPRAEKLPPDLKDLAYRNGVELTHARWNSDLQLLIKSLHPLVDAKRPATADRQTTTTSDQRTDGSGVAAGTARETNRRSTTTTDDEGKRPAWRTFLVLAALIVVSIGIGAYFLYSGSVTVPEVTGSTLAEATARVQSAGLTVGSRTEQIDAAKDPNTVLGQAPAPNQRVSKGSKVDLIVSPPPVLVPDVVGKGIENAKQALGEVRLTIGDVEREASETASRNTVLDMFPPAGTSARPGSKVALRVAETPDSVPPPQTDTIPVPSVENKTYADAESALRNAGLTVGNVAAENRSDIAPGIVTHQSPIAGAKVASGARVYLTVSKRLPAVKMVAVPALIKKNLTDATVALHQQGLVLGQVTVQAQELAPGYTDIVINQSPPNGSQVAPGSAVDVTIAVPPKQQPGNDSGAAAFGGRWVNDNSATRGMTRIDVIPNPSTGTWSVHAFGACSPADCDWGTTEAKLVKGVLVVYWEQGFVSRRMILTPDGDRLRMNMQSVYKDNRPRQDSQEYFVKAVQGPMKKARRPQ